MNMMTFGDALADVFGYEPYWVGMSHEDLCPDDRSELPEDEDDED
jgi:hypothetical protein